jgi:hypothetical protein
MKNWEVTYQMGATGSKYHKKTVEAKTQYEANAIAHCEMPDARLCGMPRYLPLYS